MPPSKPNSNQPADKPSALLLAYYGDDFTGSTDVMEALSQAGLRTVLFLKPPTPEQLAGFPGLRAFGIAGGSRTMSPEGMERELPLAFEALKASSAPIIHYKLCSTFDSSPKIGSIGRAIEIGRRVFGDRPTPLVVGAPVLGRYVAFGNLFARSGLDTEPSRLDRHPTMSRHPVTPMSEADIRVILAEQTKLPVELVNVVKLDQAGSSRREEAQPPNSAFRIPHSALDQSLLTSAATNEGPPIILFDTLQEAHLPTIGQEIERLAQTGQLFVAGSSGIEYALVEHWRAAGRMPRSEPAAERPSPVKQIVAVSGSCSPVTDRQIANALRHGFEEISLHAKHLVKDDYLEAARSSILLQSAQAPKAGKGLILHTSRGPEDARMLRGKKTVETASARIGHALAVILEDLLDMSGLRRAVVCGGDTSTHVARALGIEALEYLGPMAPGSPLCKVHAPGRIVDGCEIVFKGGQVGRDDFFRDVLNGGPQRD